MVNSLIGPVLSASTAVGETAVRVVGGGWCGGVRERKKPKKKRWRQHQDGDAEQLRKISLNRSGVTSCASRPKFSVAPPGASA
jgi:hypothetical protein